MARQEAGISQLVEQPRDRAPGRIVMTTAGFELPLPAALGCAVLPAAAINPRQVRDCAKTTGRPARADAQQPDSATRELCGLLARRRQLIGMRTVETNRLALAVEAVRPEIREQLRWLNKRIKCWIASCMIGCERAHSGVGKKICRGVLRRSTGAQSDAVGRGSVTTPELSLSGYDRDGSAVNACRGDRAAVGRAAPVRVELRPDRALRRRQPRAAPVPPLGVRPRCHTTRH
jgi:hypothetical protein